MFFFLIDLKHFFVELKVIPGSKVLFGPDWSIYLFILFMEISYFKCVTEPF